MVILAWLTLLFYLSINLATGRADSISPTLNSEANFTVYPGDTTDAGSVQQKSTQPASKYSNIPQKRSSNTGSLKLNAVPNLNFGKISLNTIYNGARIHLYRGDSRKNNPLTVADYRGYSETQRGWSVNAIITPLVNGPFSIAPTVTLRLRSDNKYYKTAGSVTLTTKTTTPVLTSLELPTHGVKSVTILAGNSSTLNFNSLTRKQRNNFQPGKYHGRIIWTLNNTASND